MTKPLLAGLLLGAWTMHATPLSITVNPPTVTNNYVGSIVLSISNLSSPGAMVRVDRVLDVNSNGIIDSRMKWAANRSLSPMDGNRSSAGCAIPTCQATMTD